MYERRSPFGNSRLCLVRFAVRAFHELRKVADAATVACVVSHRRVVPAIMWLQPFVVSQPLPGTAVLPHL